MWNVIRMTLAHLVDVARGLIKVHETGRWAHINVKLLHVDTNIYCATSFVQEKYYAVS